MAVDYNVISSPDLLLACKKIKTGKEGLVKLIQKGSMGCLCVGLADTVSISVACACI